MYKFQKKKMYLGLEECKNHLHSKIVLVKRGKSLMHLNVCKKLNRAWKSIDYWKVIPPDKGIL